MSMMFCAVAAAFTNAYVVLSFDSAGAAPAASR